MFPLNSSFLVLAPLAFGLYVVLELTPKLKHIPSVGYGGRLSSYLSAFVYMKRANVVLQEGYQQYKNKLFKVPQLDKWLVIATGEKLTENLRAAPENVLSMEAAMSDILQSDYTLGVQIRQDPYHISVIRFSLNKNLPKVFPQVLDELTHAFHDELDTKIQEGVWTPIPAIDTFLRIVCRASNRIFVGLPTCRNKDYCDVNIQFAINVMVGASIINLFPESLKPWVGRAFTKISGHLRCILKQLGPVIEERQKLIARYGPEYPDKPNDLLTWLMESATPGYEQTAEGLALRILNVNFVALHSSTMTFTHALYHLASKPEYIPILRAEVEEKLGVNLTEWTDDQMEACWKLDSFLKESQRLNGLGALSMPRKALRPYTFSDGTTLPAGTLVAATATATHLDDSLWERADIFDPFRFSNPREKIAATNKDIPEDGNKGEDIRLRLTGTGLNYLSFGGGKHACPGRFFASQELKSIMAFLVMKYDVKTEQDGVRPIDEWFGAACIPNRNAKILFRRRS